MKQLISLTLFFISTTLFAQVQKLSQLSKGEFIDSEIVKDDKTQDVYGYFFLYQIDSKAKDLIEYEFVLLDNNLNKITNNTFEQKILNPFLRKSDLIISSVKKQDDEVIIEFSNLERKRNRKYHHRYRKLNLKDFKLSDSFVIQENIVVPDHVKLDESIETEDFIKNQQLLSTLGDYFIVYDTPKINRNSEKGLSTLEKLESTNGFTVLDKNLKATWRINFEGNYQKLIASDSTTFITTSKDRDDFNFSKYYIYNKKNGFVNSISLSDEEYAYFVNDISFINQDIILNTTYSNIKKNKIKNQVGFAKLVIDKETGKLKEKHLLPWTDFEPELAKVNITGKINKYHKIKNYGFIKIQDYQSLENGKTLAIGEGYKFGTTFGYLMEIFVIELDKNYKITYFNKVDKNETKIRVDPYQIMTHEIPFDYLYSQNLDNNGNKVFYYVNNEKEGGIKQKRKNPKWVLGIITYVDGKFEYDKLELTKKDSQIIPGVAKNGYIRLLEIEENGETEVRLEKINY